MIIQSAGLKEKRLIPGKGNGLTTYHLSVFPGRVIHACYGVFENQNFESGIAGRK